MKPYAINRVNRETVFHFDAGRTIYELVDDAGNERAVDPAEHTFDVGDSFLVRIRPHDDLYVYVFNEGPEGWLQVGDGARPVGWIHPSALAAP